MFELDEPTDKYLYHYTKEKTFIEKIWPGGKLKLSPFSQTNDPRESHMWNYIFSFPFSEHQDHSSQDGLLKMFKLNEQVDNEVRKCKILCLSMDYQEKPKTINYGRGFQHPRMWAQYADNHGGICLVFNKKKLLDAVQLELEGKGLLWMGAVKYLDKDDYADIAMKVKFNECSKDVAGYMKNHINKNYQDFYFRKHVDWVDEQEFRIVLRDENDDPVFISFEDSLELVIYGVDFPRELVPPIDIQCVKLKKRDGQLMWRNGLPDLTIYDEVDW